MRILNERRSRPGRPARHHSISAAYANNCVWVRPPGVSLALPDCGRPIDIVSGRLRRAGLQPEENARELARSRPQLVSCAVNAFGRQFGDRAARLSLLTWRLMHSPRAGQRGWKAGYRDCQPMGHVAEPLTGPSEPTEHPTHGGEVRRCPGEVMTPLGSRRGPPCEMQTYGLDEQIRERFAITNPDRALIDRDDFRASPLLQ